MTLYEPAELTPQYRHLKAAESCEKALRHHQTAAMLHESGDARQAQIHADMARKYVVDSLMACDSNLAL